MQVKELMTTKVKVIGPETTVQEAARQMAASDVGALPVAQDGKIVGMLTDRDIAVRVLGKGLDPTSTIAGQVMTKDIFAVQPEQDVTEAARGLQKRLVRRAPVIDKEQHLVGIISLGDLAAKHEDAALSGGVLRGIAQSGTPNH
jgi:CBS domain-containing protein